MDNDSSGLFESKSHSFIIKIWIEETTEEADKTIWRGYITHVPGGERRYFQNLNAITEFIAPYVRGIGVNLGWFGQVTQFLNRLRIYLKALQ